MLKIEVVLLDGTNVVVDGKNMKVCDIYGDVIDNYAGVVNERLHIRHLYLGSGAARIRSLKITAHQYRDWVQEGAVSENLADISEGEAIIIAPEDVHDPAVIMRTGSKVKYEILPPIEEVVQ